VSNYIMAVDCGFRATGLAIFDLDSSPPKLAHVCCIRPKKDTKKKHLLTSDNDVDMTARMVRGIVGVVRDNHISKMVVELPSGGALSARAQRAMGIATGVMVTLVECEKLAVEYYTPSETREAAVGKVDLGPRVKKGTPPEEAKRIKKERAAVKKNIKERVMAAMEVKYPDLAQVALLADKEHICDAVATFEAAKNGNLVRMSKGGNNGEERN